MSNSSYSAPSQILARQLDYIKNKHILLAGELEDNFASKLSDIAASVSIFTTNLAYANQMQAYGTISVQFGAEYKSDEAKLLNKTTQIDTKKAEDTLEKTHKAPIDMLILYWPKAKAEAAFLLSMLMSALGQGAEIIVVGENRSGIKSIEKMFTPYGPISKYDSARRCSFYWGQCDNTPHSFIFNDYFKTYPLQIGDKVLKIRALPGVFSQNELDAGTALLLNNLPKLEGKILDFGCGAGVIGAVIKTLNPNVRLCMADISALAVASARETLKANQLEGKVIATDGYSAIKESFDHIISNPPFHAGLKTHYAATEAFLLKAPQYLLKRGKLTIVANSFLQYIPFIENAFEQCVIKAKTKHFSIYHAQKP